MICVQISQVGTWSPAVIWLINRQKITHDIAIMIDKNAVNFFPTCIIQYIVYVLLLISVLYNLNFFKPLANKQELLSK